MLNAKNAPRVMNTLERKIFRNKRKSVKSLPIAQISDENETVISRPHLSTFFPRITSLGQGVINELICPRIGSKFVSTELERNILHSYGYFWKGFRCVKHLEISNKNKYFWLIVKETNSSTHFLSSLEILKLSLEFEEDPTENSFVRDLLLELEKNGHFLSNITSLDFEEFPMFHCYDEITGSILSQCPKLVSLKFPIGREAKFFESADDIYRECQEIAALEEIENMETLKTLSVSAYGIKTLAKYFVVPASVQKLSLHVGHSSYKPDLLNLFHKPKYGFFERWKKLNNLHTLKLKMRVIPKCNDLLLNFARPLLEAIPNLKKFKFELTESPACWKPSPLDFSLLLENTNIVKQLETLKIVA